MFGFNLSLKYKFLFIIAAVLLLATLSYLGLAVQLFNTDKKAYIYDNNAALVETIGEETTTGVLGSLKTMRMVALTASKAVTIADSLETLKSMVTDDDSIVFLRSWIVASEAESLQAPLVDLHSDAYLESFDLKADYLNKLTTAHPLPVQMVKKQSLNFFNAALPDGPPLLGVRLAIESETDPSQWLLVEAYLRQDRRVTTFQRSALYTSYLLDSQGLVLAHTDPTVMAQRVSVGEEPGVKSILASPLAKGVIEVEANTERAKIVAFKKLPLGGLIVVSEIPASKAYIASKRLIEKSGWFAVLVLSVSFLISILFVKKLTAAIQSLYQATLKISRGDFNVKLKVESKDEVGALSQSFNTMAQEIDRLVTATADKARMEKELETAQLVQENFFPKGDIVFGDFEVSAFFKPASECGGDWWGSLKVGDKLILLIGDATGHGVPAALITAAAHSCAMTLRHLSHKMPALVLSPSFLLECLNAAICQAGRGQVKMTFFAAVLDGTSGEMTYANASHDMPIIFRGSKQLSDKAEPKKEYFDSLDHRPDPCLGESAQTQFKEYKTTLEPADSMLLFTDGLIECRNPQSEEFGERRLLKSFLTLAGSSTASIKDGLIGSANNFFQKDVQEDDITLVVVKNVRRSRSLPVAG